MKNFRLLFKHTKYKTFIAYIVLTIVLNALSIGLTIVLPFIFGKNFSLMKENTSIDFSLLFKYLNIAFIVIVGNTFLQLIICPLNSFLSYQLMYELRKKLFKKLQAMPLKYLDSTPHGSIISTYINDVEQVGDGLLLVLNQLISGILMVFGTVFFMFYINWFIGLFVVLFTPLSIFFAKFITTRTYHFFRKVASERANATANIDEYIDNIKVIKHENYGEKASLKFKAINDELGNYSFKAVFYSSWVNPVTRFINNIIYVVTILIGSLFIINKPIGQALDIGLLISLLSYSAYYAKPFNEITQVFSEIQNAFASSERIINLLDEKEEDKYLEQFNIDHLSGSVDFNHVNFSYTEKPLIEDLNLHIKQGDCVAIVGSTGAGKTTIINLIMRFYSTQSGNICIDNFDIETLKKDSFRKQIGMVLQESWIKHASIKDNVSIGKPDATMDVIIDACKKAYIHDTIMKLENGYDTIINDSTSLSQGEKQLLCIARIMLLNPKMLIFDEATSNIDTQTEIKIQESLKDLINNHTSFIVAHRLSTIKNADLIIVLDHGNIIESGKHEELLVKKGHYFEIYNAQFVQNKE